MVAIFWQAISAAVVRRMSKRLQLIENHLTALGRGLRIREAEHYRKGASI
jgi:hypothetical protein